MKWGRREVRFIHNNYLLCANNYVKTTPINQTRRLIDDYVLNLNI